MSEKTAGTEAKKVTSWGRKMPGSKRKVVILLLAVFVSLAGYFGYQVYQDSKKPEVKEYTFTEEQLRNYAEQLKKDPNALPNGNINQPANYEGQFPKRNKSYGPVVE